MTEPFRDRNFVHFLVVSPNQIPDRTSAQLMAAVGIPPDGCYDDDRPGSPALVYESGLPESAPFSEQVAALLARLEPARERLADLVHTGTVVTRLRLSGEVADVSVDLVLEPAQLAFMADVGLIFSLHADYHEGREYYRKKGQRYRDERRSSEDFTD